MPAPRQWLWFVAPWVGGVGTVAVLAFAIKFWLP